MVKSFFSLESFLHMSHLFSRVTFTCVFSHLACFCVHIFTYGLCTFLFFHMIFPPHESFIWFIYCMFNWLVFFYYYFMIFIRFIYFHVFFHVLFILTWFIFSHTILYKWFIFWFIYVHVILFTSNFYTWFI